jgi:hypothetical protein
LNRSLYLCAYNIDDVLVAVVARRVVYASLQRDYARFSGLDEGYCCFKGFFGLSRCN